MATPTMSVRAPTEHHQRIRRIARALMDHPELAGALDTLIEGVTPLNTTVIQDMTTDDQPNTAAVQRIEAVEQRLAAVERQYSDLHGQYSDLQLRHDELQKLVVEEIQGHMALQDTTAVALSNRDDSLADRVKALEERANPQAATQQHDPATQQHDTVTQQHSNTATRVKRQSRTKTTKST